MSSSTAATPTAIIPTLDTQSILANPKDIMAYVLRYYFTAPKSVSNTTYAMMASFAETASRYQSVPSNLVAQVEADLQNVYNRFFPIESTTVNISSSDNGDGSYNIIVQVSTIQNGTSYALGSDVSVNANGVLEIKWHPNLN